MAKSLRQQVWERARGRCEYCQLPHNCTTLPHEIDHIRAQKHRGPTTLRNLCLACACCNAYKGSDVASYDPESGELVALFNPRRHRWANHFRWNGAFLVGKSPMGRATIELLNINDPERVEHRRMLLELGFLHLMDD